MVSISYFINRTFNEGNVIKALFKVSTPLRPCLLNSLSCTNPVNICVSINTSRNLLRLLEDTALRNASRWNAEGVGEEENEAEDSSSRSLPPMKRG